MRSAGRGPLTPSRIWQDTTCVLHCHSTHSDGTGTVGEIARAARRARVDAVLLTDHDTLAARTLGEDGMQHGVLVVCGHEITPGSVNHLLAFGLAEPVAKEGRDAAALAAAVRDAGGLGVGAHPWSKGNEAVRPGKRGNPFEDRDALDALELWSLATDTLEQARSKRHALAFLLAPDRWLTGPPAANLADYDRMTEHRRVVAVGGVDAHQLGIRVRGRWPLAILSYRRTFGLLRTHVLLPADAELTETAILEAIAAGHCYLARDSLAPATGFAFEAAGGTAVMGDELALADAGELRVRAPRASRILLLHAGAEVAAADGTELVHTPATPGPYRVEVHLRRHGRDRAWVLSNPIYLR